ncbi:MAG: urease accessory protein UreD, partial [Thermomicrobiales bacterium]
VPAQCTTSLAVAEAGTLWWLPGTLIPYRDARYSAHRHVSLDEGSHFAALEVLTAGRTAMGESDAYARLDLRLRIEVGGTPVLIERAVLDPNARPRPFRGGQEQFRCSGSLILVGYELPPDVENCQDDVWLGADSGPRIAVVRGASRAAEPLRVALMSVLYRLQIEHDATVQENPAGTG